MPGRGPRSAVALLLVLSLAAPAAAADGLPWEVGSVTLPNGLEVHVVPMPTPGVVAWQTRVAVGSGHEVEPGRTGFAHFFEHLMFFGTEALPADLRERALLRMGVEENAWTWLDETVYHAIVPATQLERWSEIEADRFLRLALTPDDVRREAGAVYGEFRKGRSDPGWRLHERLVDAAYDVHPYEHDTIGYEADIAAMPDSFAHARAFFETWYRPERTTIIVAGDVQPDRVHASVARHWAGWERGTTASPEIPVEPEQSETRRVELEWEGPAAPRLAMAWKIPAHDPDDPDVAALQLAADLLLAPDGPLRRRLVHDEALAYEVDGGRDRTAAPGLFRIEIVLTDLAHLDEAEQIVRDAVAGLGGTAPSTLERTRDRTRYGLLTSLDDPATVADVVGEAATVGGSPDSVERFLSRTAAVDAADLARVAGRYLVDDRLTVAILRPNPVEAE